LLQVGLRYLYNFRIFNGYDITEGGDFIGSAVNIRYPPVLYGKIKIRFDSCLIQTKGPETTFVDIVFMKA